jgi:hypothetical protein
MKHLIASFEWWQLQAAVSLLFSTMTLTLCQVTVRRSRKRLVDAEIRFQRGIELSENSIRSLQTALETLSSEVRNLSQHPVAAQAAGPLKPGLNLSKRSQALRMHRRGDSLEQIGAALEIPLQEVDLLLKVHRIVLSTI